MERYKYKNIPGYFYFENTEEGLKYVLVKGKEQNHPIDINGFDFESKNIWFIYDDVNHKYSHSAYKEDEVDFKYYNIVEFRTDKEYPEDTPEENKNYNAYLARLVVDTNEIKPIYKDGKPVALDTNDNSLYDIYEQDLIKHIYKRYYILGNFKDDNIVYTLDNPQDPNSPKYMYTTKITHISNDLSIGKVNNKVINAVEIDWNNAYVGGNIGDKGYIKSTSDILKAINDIARIETPQNHYVPNDQTIIYNTYTLGNKKLSFDRSGHLVRVEEV